MSNGSEGRKAHIRRIYQNNDSESNVWIDVEQIDELWFTTSQGQKEHWTFDWDKFDEPSATKKQISDPNDPDNLIEIPIRTALRFSSSYGQGYEHFFLNSDSNRSRGTHSRRIYHHEIKDDYLDGAGQPPSDPDNYLSSLGDQDQDQYVDVEVIDTYWTSQPEGRVLHKKKRRRPPTIGAQKKKWFLSSVDPLLQDPMLVGDVQDPDFIPIHNPEDDIVDPPWRIDPLQNIVNVSWGGGVIVVFVTAAPTLAQPPAFYTVLEDKARLLGTFSATADSGQPSNPCSAFKVLPNAGEFIRTTAPTLPATEQPLGALLTVCVFAPDAEGEEKSLERAIAGTQLILAAMYNILSTTPSDFPADMAPPGLLWLVQTGMMFGEQNLTWKMRHGAHRVIEEGGDEADKPPNNMTQCYHLEVYNGPSGGIEVYNWIGYRIFAYRLDRNGTDTVYGEMISNPPGDPTGAFRQNIDPAWHQELVASAGESGMGIPATDPPPLVTLDLQTS